MRRRGKEHRWRSTTLGDAAEFVNGRAFRPEDWRTAGVPIIRIQNLNGSPDFNYFTGDVEPRHSIRPGDLLFGWSGNRGTSFGAHEWPGPAGVLNQHIFKVVARDSVDARFLGHLMNWATSRIERRAHGASGLVHVTKPELESFRIVLPNSISQQRTIASVLDKSASALRVVENLLAGKRRLKRALLQQLLTGKRRFPDAKTDTWSTVRLSAVSEINPESLLESTSPDHQFFYVDLSAVDQGRIQWPVSKTAFGKAPSRARRIVAPGDVLMATVRPTLLGFARLPELEDVHVVSTGFAVIRANRPDDSELIYQALYSRSLMKQVEAKLAGSSFPAIGASDVAALRVPWPNSPRTRERIGGLLRRLDHEIALLDRQLAALRRLKRGLMQKLLTGELDVPTEKKQITTEVPA